MDNFDNFVLLRYIFPDYNQAGRPYEQNLNYNSNTFYQGFCYAARGFCHRISNLSFWNAMKFNVAQVIGLNTDQKAAQVISSSNDCENIFLAALNISCDDAFTKGRQFLSEASDLYFESEGSPADKINATYKQVAGNLKSRSDSFDLCLAVVSGKILYLISEGKIEVILKRGDKLSSLLNSGSPDQLISGFLQDGDKVLFATSTLISFLGEDLSNTLESDLEVFEEEVSAKIAAQKLDVGNLAGLLLNLKDESVNIPNLPETPKQSILNTDEAEDKIFNKTKFLGLIKKYFPNSGRTRLILGAVLVMIILAGIGFKYKSSQDQQILLTFNQNLQKGRDDFNTAQSLHGLNPQEAKNKLDSARESINKALALIPKNGEALKMKQQIEENEDSILQRYETSNFPQFLDLDLVKKNFRAEKMSLSGSNILMLDPGTKTLIIINLAKKNNQILAGSDQLGEAISASINGGLAFIYSKDKGIIRIDTSNQKRITVAKIDSGLDAPADIYGFAGNVYLLDAGSPSTSSGQVWKYLPTSEGYSDKREYLSKNTKADFTGSLRMQIESSIYVLKKGGEILRFTKGDKDYFSLSGLPSGVKDPKSFFVSSDTDNLYLLDSGNSRLLVLSKTGEFKSQYQGDKFAQVTDLVVDEKGKKVYLLEGSKIFTAELK